MTSRSISTRVLLISLMMTIVFGLLIESGILNRVLAQQSSAPLTRAVFSNPELVKRYQQTINPETLASRLYFLASDLFEGRETTTRGQKLAAQYLASQYRLLGLAPKGTQHPTEPFSPAAFWQPFTVYRRTPEETRIELLVNGSREASSTFSTETHDDMSFPISGDFEDSGAGVIFAGYGIADDKLGYNDFAALAQKGISIDGKWILILADEPLGNAETALLPTPDHKPSKWSQLLSKRAALLTAGKPKGLLVITDSSKRMQGSFADAGAAAAVNARRVGALSIYRTSSAIQAYAISTKFANQILAPAGRTVEELQRRIDQSLKPEVFSIEKVTINTQVKPGKELQTENIAAFLEGSDPQLKDQVLVISSHYDHLGVNPQLKGDQIFNGAADDGSGVVASLELARAFMKAKQEGFGPRRSILFLNFSGEEKGTLGSAYYVGQEPIIPLEQTVADINMDGVGGIDLKHPSHSKNYIYISGVKDASDELATLNQRVKDLTGTNLELTYGVDFPSDQRSFQAQLVPFIYYSTGLTEHYHQVTDEARTIDYDHLARVAQLIFATAWQVANQDTRPTTVDRTKLIVVGYVCPKCPFECDDAVYDHPGECPVCGMILAPRFMAKG